MRFEGAIKSWNDERGYGFIAPSKGDQEIFVHIKAFGTRSGRPQVGDCVTFEIELNSEGKKRARNVMPLRAARTARRSDRESPAQWGTATLFVVPLFCVVYTVAAILWRVPGWVAVLYLGTSAVTFILYWIDKSAAEAGRWRVSESTLLSAGLLGGWPGAIVAQQLLRHKSNKVSFRKAFWATVGVNVAAFLGLSSPLALQILRS